MLRVYDIRLLICSTCKLPATFTLFLFWVFGYAHTQLRSLFPLSPPWHCSREKKYQALPTCTTSVFALWSGGAWGRGYAATQLSLIPILFLNFWIVHVQCADYGLEPGNIAVRIMSILSSLLSLSDQFCRLFSSVASLRVLHGTAKL